MVVEHVQGRSLHKSAPSYEYIGVLLLFRNVFWIVYLAVYKT